MLQSIFYAILRSILAFILLMLVIRWMGRKAVSEMTYFDFGIVLTFGSVTANIGFGEDRSLTSTITVLIMFGVFGVLVGYLQMKSFRFHKMISSDPLVIIDNGDIIKSNMKKARMTLTELTSLLRAKDMFNINDVLYAVLEGDGTLSVLPKADKAPLTPSDMNLHPAEKGLTRDLILDGEIRFDNLRAAKLTLDWLMRELKARRVEDIHEVFYAALDPSGVLYVSKGGHETEDKGQHGIE